MSGDNASISATEAAEDIHEILDRAGVRRVRPGTFAPLYLDERIDLLRDLEMAEDEGTRRWWHLYAGWTPDETMWHGVFGADAARSAVQWCQIVGPVDTPPEKMPDRKEYPLPAGSPERSVRFRLLDSWDHDPQVTSYRQHYELNEDVTFLPWVPEQRPG